MIRFVTGNEGKLREAQAYLRGRVEQVEYGYTEIQSDELTEIAAVGAREAFLELDGGGPIMVEDSGLFIDDLDGFPGPYSAYVERTVGVEAVWRLAERECRAPRRARFRSVIAYAEAGSDDGVGAEPTDPRIRTVEGSVRGRIVAPRGTGGFGYDPIFEHNGRTMAEMTTEEKNAISHRGRALAKLAEWLADRS